MRCVCQQPVLSDAIPDSDSTGYPALFIMTKSPHEEASLVTRYAWVKDRARDSRKQWLFMRLNLPDRIALFEAFAYFDTFKNPQQDGHPWDIDAVRQIFSAGEESSLIRRITMSLFTALRTADGHKQRSDQWSSGDTILWKTLGLTGFMYQEMMRQRIGKTQFMSPVERKCIQKRFGGQILDPVPGNELSEETPSYPIHWLEFAVRTVDSINSSPTLDLIYLMRFVWHVLMCPYAAERAGASGEEKTPDDANQHDDIDGILYYVYDALTLETAAIPNDEGISKFRRCNIFLLYCIWATDRMGDVYAMGAVSRVSASYT